MPLFSATTSDILPKTIPKEGPLTPGTGVSATLCGGAQSPPVRFMAPLAPTASPPISPASSKEAGLLLFGFRETGTPFPAILEASVVSINPDRGGAL